MILLQVLPPYLLAGLDQVQVREGQTESWIEVMVTRTELLLLLLRRTKKRRRRRRRLQ